MKLINYQNMRGGRVVFQDIAKAKTDDWYSALSAVEASLDLEKKVHEVIEPHCLKKVFELILKMAMYHF